MRRFFAVIAVSIAALFNMNCNAQQAPDQNIKASELKERHQKNDPNMVILDVRTAEELTGPLGKINGDLIHIPLHELQSRMNELEQYKDKEIAVVCRSGNRSGIATGMLRSKGFNAKNMTGGMIEYNR